MNTGAKLAIAGIGTAIVVVIIYAMTKSRSNAVATSASAPVTQPSVPIMNYNDKKIDTSAISRPAVNSATTVQPPSATYNPPPIPGGIGYFKNKPPMIARD